MSDLVTAHMVDKGVTFKFKVIPVSVEKKSNGKLLVTYKNVETNETASEEFDTVLFAVGRKALTAELNVKAAGIDVDSETSKIISTNEKTNVPHIYAVGDVLFGRPELTPVAIKAGILLAKRIFGGSKDQMDYDNVATTVFSPLEYGCVGLSEEKAIERYGEENIEVHHAFYKPTEFFIPQKSVEQCYLKVISLLSEPQTVVGIHFVGPVAGEVIQGYAAAMK